MDLRDVREFLIDSARYIFVVFFVLFLVIYVVSLQQVIGPSMKPNFNDGDVLLLSKSHYKVFKIKRSDVVSLKDNNSKNFIKRIVGLPGEHVEFKNNELYINNKKVKEDYIKDVKTDDFLLENIGYDIIPEDMYLVLGDNRENSLDSRSFGLVKKEDLLGKVVFRIFPITKIRIYK